MNNIIYPTRDHYLHQFMRFKKNIFLVKKKTPPDKKKGGGGCKIKNIIVQ